MECTVCISGGRVPLTDSHGAIYQKRLTVASSEGNIIRAKTAQDLLKAENGEIEVLSYLLGFYVYKNHSLFPANFLNLLLPFQNGYSPRLAVVGIHGGYPLSNRLFLLQYDTKVRIFSLQKRHYSDAIKHTRTRLPISQLQMFVAKIMPGWFQSTMPLRILTLRVRDN